MMWISYTCRALEVWGSWTVLERELKRKRLEAQEEDLRRQGEDQIGRIY